MRERFVINGRCYLVRWVLTLTSLGCTAVTDGTIGVLQSTSRPQPLMVEATRVPTCGQRVQIDAFDVCLDPRPRDFLDASRNCRALGGGLFEITTRERAYEVAQAFGSAEEGASAWIGVFRGNEGTWQLAHTGQAPTIEEWGEGEPNDAGGEEDCVEVLQSGRWNDAHCGVSRPFLCEPTAPTRTPFSCTGRARLVDEGRACLHAEPLTFLFAQAKCVAAGGRLLTVDSFEEGQRLAEILAAQNGDVWFGLSDLAEEGSWFTQTGAKIQFDGWRPGEPNDVGARGEDCATVGLGDARWNDAPCDVKTRSLCGIPISQR